jgi:hypothetical protein
MLRVRNEAAASVLLLLSELGIRGVLVAVDPM